MTTLDKADNRSVTSGIPQWEEPVFACGEPMPTDFVEKLVSEALR
jgi:hypothetical protein